MVVLVFYDPFKTSKDKELAGRNRFYTPEAAVHFTLLKFIFGTSLETFSCIIIFLKPLRMGSFPTPIYFYRRTFAYFIIWLVNL